MDDATRLGEPDPDVTSVRLTPAGHASAAGTGLLAVGQNFGSRYHIIRLLGVGGMGSVYQAWDQELEVAVAVKVIRPDVTADPAVAQDLERRFKRELLLARQVTDKHVVRIHDIGEIDGIKYITMPYVHGFDVASILKREGKLPVARVLSIARQVASGLVAAHEAGVVHRDLKPANIMVDEEDHALIMDFGIARSTSGATAFAMTVGAQVIGTVEYMAPEQARGEAVDQRADVYAFGLIVRDMLLGGRHAGSTSAVTELMARMRQAPTALRDVDPTIPEGVDTLVTRCLQPDAADRYQTSAELLRDLNRLAEDGRAAIAPVAGRWRRTLMSRGPLVPMLAALALLLIVGAGVLALKAKFVAPRGGAVTASLPARPSVSLAVLPFRNASSDPALDSLGTSLSEVLATDLGAASHIRTVPSERLHKVLHDLRIDRQTNLSPAELTRLADFANAGSILWGWYTRFGEEIQIYATLQDLEQNTTSQLQVKAQNQAVVLAAVGELAHSVRAKLAAGSEDVLKELKATAWRPSTQSFEALRLYNEGLHLSRDGNHQGAAKRFDAAIAEDAQFALAYSALAQTYDNLGDAAQAAQSARRAVALSASLPAQERYLISAMQHRLANQPDQAIEMYEKLHAVSPHNAAIRFDLAALYEQTGNLDKAAEHFGKAVELDPKHVEGLTAVGRVAIKRGAPQDALQPLNNALSLSIQLNNDEARANVLQAIGVAYKRLGKPNDALKQYQESLAIKRRIGQKAGMAASLGEIAQIQEMLGTPRDAIKSYSDALALQREIGDKSRLSTTLISYGDLLNQGLGRPDDALPPLQEALSIARDLGNRGMEALALNNIGAAHVAKGRFPDAQTYFERALQIREASKVPREMADTLHNLGETLNRMGKYDQALSHYMRALQLRRDDDDKRNEAIESYSMATIFDYQGRYGAAVESKSEALRTFREIKQRDFWLGEILSGYGSSLALAGRSQEAAKYLEEAAALGRELQNPGLVAQVARFQAERLFYTGDVRGAARLADEAAQAAARSQDQTLIVWAQAEVARVAAAGQPTRAVAAELAGIGRRAEAAGLRYLSVSCALERAHTLVRAGDHRQGRQEIARVIANVEGLGLRELAVKAEYVRATALRLAKDSQARKHYALTLQLLDELRREKGNQSLLDRADLKALHDDSLVWSRAS
jgi:serine/threonine protein kinase/tetratricopeptide (TPR) repeat protein